MNDQTKQSDGLADKSLESENVAAAKRIREALYEQRVVHRLQEKALALLDQSIYEPRTAEEEPFDRIEDLFVADHGASRPSPNCWTVTLHTTKRNGMYFVEMLISSIAHDTGWMTLCEYGKELWRVGDGRAIRNSIRNSWMSEPVWLSIVTDMMVAARDYCEQFPATLA